MFQGPHNQLMMVLLALKDRLPSGQLPATIGQAAFLGHLEGVKVHLEQGAEVNAQVGNPLSAAVRGNQPEVLDLLVLHGAVPQENLLEDLHKHPAVLQAFRKHFPDTWEVWDAEAQTQPVPSRTAGMHSLKGLLDQVGGQGSWMQQLVQRQQELRQLPAHELLQQARALILELGSEALQVEVEAGEPLLTTCAGLGEVDLLDLLLQQGADPTADHHSALIAATWQARLEAMQWLLERGADPNALRGNLTPLCAAAHSGVPQAVQLLLQQSADPGVAVHLGIRPMDWAQGPLAEQITQLLLENLRQRRAALPHQPSLRFSKTAPGLQLLDSKVSASVAAIEATVQEVVQRLQQRLPPGWKHHPREARLELDQQAVLLVLQLKHSPWTLLQGGRLGQHHQEGLDLLQSLALHLSQDLQTRGVVLYSQDHGEQLGSMHFKQGNLTRTLQWTPPVYQDEEEERWDDLEDETLDPPSKEAWLEEALLELRLQLPGVVLGDDGLDLTLEVEGAAEEEVEGAHLFSQSRHSN